MNNSGLLKGLVLMGGKSKRMGRDKSSLKYHGISQRVFAARLLKQFCQEVFVSCRNDQQSTLEPELTPLVDMFENKGPIGGILTALHFNSKCAWLVIACDLPLLSSDTIYDLIDARNPVKLATAYMNPDDLLPEPLIAIYEPACKTKLLEAVENGNYCPRKFLIQTDCNLILPAKRHTLTNCNTPEEYQETLLILNNLNSAKKPTR